MLQILPFLSVLIVLTHSVALPTSAENVARDEQSVPFSNVTVSKSAQLRAPSAVDLINNSISVTHSVSQTTGDGWAAEKVLS